MSAARNIIRTALYILSFFTVILLSTCTKDEELVYPTIELTEIINVTDTSVTVEGLISPVKLANISEFGFCWDTFRFADRPVNFFKPVSENNPFEKFRSTILKNIFTELDHRISSYYILNKDTIVSPSRHFRLTPEANPFILSIVPDSAISGDIIRLFGLNLGFSKQNTTIRFDSLFAEILEIRDAAITVIVPDSLKKELTTINIDVSGKTGASKNQFKLIKSQISDYHPKSFIPSKTIIVYGRNFPLNRQSLSVESNGLESEIMYVSDTILKFIFPLNTDLTKQEIRIKTGSIWHVLSPSPEVLSPAYESFSPASGMWNDTILILGHSFGNLPEDHKVLLGEIEANPFYSNDSVLKVVVPAIENDEIVTISMLLNENTIPVPGSFRYLTPEITQVHPTLANFGDTVTITGNNFSYFHNEVSTEGIISQITDHSRTQIKFIIPEQIENFSLNVSVTANGFTVGQDDAININYPDIINVSPSLCIPGDTIKIEGRSFNRREFTEVKIDGRSIYPISIRSDEILFVLPDLADLNSENPVIEIESNGYSIIDNSLVLDPPEIISYSNGTLSPGDTLAIKVKNPEYFTKTSYRLDGEFIKRINFSPEDSTFTFYIPANWFREGGEKSIIPTNHYFFSDLTTITINFHQPFKRYPLNPTSHFPYEYNQVFSKNDEIFTGLGDNYGPNPMLHKFSLVTEEWTPLTSLPEPIVMKSGGFQIETNFHLVCGSRDDNSTDSSHFVYNILEDTWTKNSPFPGEPREFPIAFVINGKGYLGGGQNSKGDLTDLWEFSVTGEWTKISDVPGSVKRVCAVHNNYLYLIVDSNELWRFNPVNLEWNYICNTEIIHEAGFIFVLNNGLYLYRGMGDYGDKSLFKYNISSGVLEKVIPLPVSLNEHTPIVLNNIAHSVGGYISPPYDCYIVSINFQ